MAFEAYIDESGQKGVTESSSDHFVLSALVCRDSNLPHLAAFQERVRARLGRAPGQRLHWKNLKEHDQRVTAATMIGETTFVRVLSVVVCRRLLAELPDSDFAYLFTLRFLMERLSWLGRQHHATVHYTLSHVKHFRPEKLRGYEQRLREAGTDTEIDWRYLDPYGGRISNDRTIEALQLADLTASATFRAFEDDPPDKPANRDYLRGLLPCMYRGIPGRENVLTAYGLKMHPWNAQARAAYPWVEELR